MDYLWIYSQSKVALDIFPKSRCCWENHWTKWGSVQPCCHRLPSPAIAQPNLSLAHGGFLSQCRARKRLKTSPVVAWTRAPWRKNKILLMVPMKSHFYINTIHIYIYISYIKLIKIGYIQMNQMIYPKAKKPCMGQESQSREWSLWSLVVPAHFEGRVVTSQRPK